MSPETLLYACLYLVSVWVTWGFLYADFQREFPTLAKRDQRSDSAGTLLLALNPISWVISPFLTGFFRHGWKNPVKFQ